MLCLGRKLEVQWDENGNLTLVGRCTDMVKIHGNRVEPAEIESVFKRLTGAGWAAVRAFAEEGSSGLLCVYYTDALSLDEDALRHRMEAYLPYYMIPSCFLRIEEIPLRPNGKLDRKALPAQDPAFCAAASCHRRARHQVQRLSLCGEGLQAGEGHRLRALSEGDL